MTKLNSNIIHESFFYLILFLPIAYVLGNLAINMTIFLIDIYFLVNLAIIKKYDFRSKILKLSLIIGALLIVHSLILNIEYTHKAIFYLRFLIFPFALSYVIEKNYLKLNLLKHFYIIFILLFSVDLFLQFKTGQNILGFDLKTINGYPNHEISSDELKNFRVSSRVSGLMGDELGAGAVLLVFGLLSILFLNNLQSKKEIIFTISSFLIILFFIFITGDRSPVIIFICFIIFLSFFIHQIRKYFFHFIIILGILIYLIFSFSPVTKYRYIDNPIELTNNKEKLFSKNKLKNILTTDWGKHYLVSLEMIKDKPLFGHGIKSSRSKCKNFIKYLDEKYRLRACSTHPHNILLEILVDTGVVGLFILLFLVFKYFQIIYTKDKNKLFRTSNKMIFLLLLAFILPIKPSGSIFSTWYGSLPWLIAGFAITRSKLKV